MPATKEPCYFGNFMEEVYGFAEAVKVGDTIYVSGQTAFMDDGSIDGVGDMGTQMARAYAGSSARSSRSVRRWPTSSTRRCSSPT